MPQEPQIKPTVTPEPDDISEEDYPDMNPSTPSAGPPSAEQRGRSRRNERSRSRERVPPHSSSQDADEDSATVDLQNRVSDRSRSQQEQEDSRRQVPQKQNGKKTTAEKQPSEPPKAKKHKFVDSASKTSLEPLQHLNLLYQYFLITLAMERVITAMKKVHRVGIPKGLCSTQISTF